MRLDLEILKRLATGGEGDEEVPVTRRCLAQIVAEISEGRAAEERLGCMALHGRRV